MSERQQAKRQQQDKKQKPSQVQRQQPDQALLEDQMPSMATPALMQRAMEQPDQAPPETMQAVQRAYGNQYVQRMAQRRPATAAAAAPVQRSLVVNEPDDQYEQEADALADTVSRTPEKTPPLGTEGGEGGDGGGSDAVHNQSGHAMRQGSEQVGTGGGEHGRSARPVPTQLNGRVFQKSSAAGVNRSLQVNEPGDAHEKEAEAAAENVNAPGTEHAPPVGIADTSGGVQRQGAGYDADNAVHAGVENQINRKRGGGESLPDPVRNKMEGHLGHDFSGVRVHTDGESDRLNRSLNAEAFTTGNDIFFSKDAYEPGSAGGQKLLAHELTHVAQQGGAPQQPVQREEQPQEEEVQRREAAESAPANRPQSPTAAPHIPGVPQPLMRTVTPIVQRQSALVIQRAEDDEEKAKKKKKEKMTEGKEKASQKKNEKQSDKDEKKNQAANQGKKKMPQPKTKPQGEPKPKLKQPRQVDAKDQVSDEELEPPEVSGGNTGSLGWPPTKAESIPDWDDEIVKYDAFKSGDFEALGVDLSGLEGDTTGLDEAITVDDPEVRRQMVIDALAGGMGGDGDAVGPLQQGMATITDAIPFAGNLMSASKFVTEGPGAWWESTKAGFSNAAANISSAWKGLGEGSGWNRAASAIELVIGLLEMVNNIAQFLTLLLTVVLVVMAIIFGIGQVLTAFVFTAAAGAAMIGFSTPFLSIIPYVLLILGLMMVQINLLVRLLREVAIAFRIIDILYFESDPDKLMERQSKLAEHVSGLNQAAHENITPGIKKKSEEEKEADNMLVGAEDLEEPLVSSFSIERVNTKEDDEKQDYKTAWMKKYGIRSTADDVREELMESEIPPPPLAVYTGEPETDVAQRIDRNAIAILELKKQRLGLAAEKEKTGASLDVAQNQHEIIGSARETMAENQKVADEHQKDIDVKLDKQDELKGQTQDTEKKGQEGGGQGMEVKGLAGIILKMLQPLMPAMQKAGEKTDESQKEGVKSGPETTLAGTDATVDSAKMGTQEAEKRTQDTKKAQKDAEQSQNQMGQTDQYLEGEQGKVEEGIDQLQNHQSEIESVDDTLAAEEERLIQERTEALNQAVEWMAEWRERRAELFEQMEERLEERLPEEDKEEEEGAEGEDAFGEEEEEKPMWDIYDKSADQGKLKGDYLSDKLQTEGESESEEEFSLEE